MKSTLLALAVVLAVGGCASDPAIKPWWTLNVNSFGDVRPGMSKEDVFSRVGKPIMESHFPNLAEDVWDYRLLEGTFGYLAEVHFDSRTGLVKYHTEYMDPTHSGGNEGQ